MALIKRFCVIHSSARAWLLSFLHDQYSKICVICRDRKTSDKLQLDLQFFRGESAILNFPAWESLPFEQVSAPSDLASKRIKTLFELSSRQSFIAMISAEALMQKVLPSSLLENQCFELKPNTLFDRTRLIAKLEISGFNQVSLV